MRVSFKKLPDQHKWLLFALLETDRSAALLLARDSLEKCYEQLCPPEVHQPYKTVVTELRNAFVRKSPILFGEEIDWVHPSCRDLAVEELAESGRDRGRFLSHCTQEGLLLATSLAGGEKGQRILPLLQKDADWQIFSRRAGKLVRVKPGLLGALWKNCEALIKKAKENVSVRKDAARFQTLVQKILIPSASKALAEEDRAFYEPRALESYFKVCAALKMRPRISLKKAWKKCQEDANNWAKSDSIIWQDDQEPSRIVQFLSVVQRCAPDEYESSVKAGHVSKILNPLAERGEDETNSIYSFGDEKTEELAEIAQGYESLAERFEKIRSLPGLSDDLRSRFSTASSHFGREASSLMEDVPIESDSGDEDYSRGAAEDLPIDDLFRDL